MERLERESGRLDREVARRQALQFDRRRYETELLDYLEVIGAGKPLTKPSAPFIAIPTTAGTGSECQSAALITDEVTHQKMACLDPKAAARVAILDPLLMWVSPRPGSAPGAGPPATP